MKRLVFSLLFTAASAAAQEPSSAIPRNDAALRNAIAGIGTRAMRSAPKPLHMDPPPPRNCSVPLQAMPIGEGPFTMRMVPGTVTPPMPQVALPAPPCEAVR